MIPSRTALVGLLLAVTSVVAGCSEDAQIRRGCIETCLPGQACDPISGDCTESSGSTPETSLQCRTALDCRAPTPLCDTDRSRCVECLDDAQCASGVCAEGVCLPVPEQCAVAQPVVVGDSPVVLRGSTLHRGNDATTSCSLGQGAPDLVYALEVKQNVRLTAVATPGPESTFLPVLELREDCASTSTDNVLACAWAWGPGLGASIVRDLAPGTYFLWVDADSGTSGEFTLELFSEPAVPGASCGLPIWLDHEERVQVIEGDTSGRLHESWGTCGGSGPEEVYAVEVEEPQRLRVTVSSEVPGYQPLVYLRRSGRCEDRSDAAELDCRAAPPGGTVVLDLPRLEPGTYALFVDGSTEPSGPYTLEVERLPPLDLAANDACGAEEVVTLTQPVVGDTRSADDSTSGFCGSDPYESGEEASDVVYSFSLSVAQPVTITVTPDPVDGALFQPAVYVRGGGEQCSSVEQADQLGCAVSPAMGSSATLQLPTLQPGKYSVWVDGVSQTSGRFTLSVQ